MTPASHPHTLDALAVGQSARVARVLGDDAMTIRLMEMGFVPGSVVEVIKLAPLRDPVEFRIRGYHVSLRRAEAARIAVEEVRGDGARRGWPWR